MSEADAFASLSKYISEEAAIRSTAKCEAALVKAHLKIRGELTDKITKQLEKLGVANPAQFFEHPSNYCGLAAVKSAKIAKKYRDLMK